MFGGICWYCYWGWPKPIADIYLRAKDDIDAIAWSDGEHALKYGPAHIVWADENWDSAEWCLKECDSTSFGDWNTATLEIVRRSLRELAELPEDIRESQPAEYDGEHPEKYPPRDGLEMVKVY